MKHNKNSNQLITYKAKTKRTAYQTALGCGVHFFVLLPLPRELQKLNAMEKYICKKTFNTINDPRL